ncbi:Lrp/AsnC family transcriptional regulator [Cellulomonas soli]
MDDIDRTILRELTTDARLPFRELGRRVGLSANAAAARVRALQRDGTIRGFTLVTARPAAPAARRASAGAGPVSPSATGPGPSPDGAPAPGAGHLLEVFIDVRLAPGSSEEFLERLHRPPGFPEVLDAVHVTGAYDYLLHALVADPGALDHLVRRLKRETGAEQTFTRLALRPDPL